MIKTIVTIKRREGMSHEEFVHFKSHSVVAVIGMLMLFGSPAVQAQQPAKQMYVTTADGVRIAIQKYGSPPKQTYAITADGVRIAIQEYGNPQGAEIVLIHGLLGSHLNWMKQVDNSLLRKYRLITYDLRGHGFSGKPTDSLSYSDGKRWGDELQTVIAATGLKRPILVGWSLGGVVITNYLQTYGDSNIAGLVFVGGVIELRSDLIKSRPENIKALSSPDLRVYLEGTRQFLQKCFLNQPDADTFKLLYAVPAKTALPKVSVPIILIQGENDNLVERKMVELGQKLMPRAKVSIYGNTGHAPFLERPNRFNEELNNFVRATSRKLR
jgi:non-heme chloroperoxidase